MEIYIYGCGEKSQKYEDIAQSKGISPELKELCMTQKSDLNFLRRFPAVRFSGPVTPEDPKGFGNSPGESRYIFTVPMNGQDQRHFVDHVSLVFDSSEMDRIFDDTNSHPRTLEALVHTVESLRDEHLKKADYERRNQDLSELFWTAFSREMESGVNTDDPHEIRELAQTALFIGASYNWSVNKMNEQVQMYCGEWEDQLSKICWLLRELPCHLRKSVSFFLNAEDLVEAGKSCIVLTGVEKTFQGANGMNHSVYRPKNNDFSKMLKLYNEEMRETVSALVNEKNAEQIRDLCRKYFKYAESYNKNKDFNTLWIDYLDLAKLLNQLLAGKETVEKLSQRFPEFDSFWIERSTPRGRDGISPSDLLVSTVPPASEKNAVPHSQLHSMGTEPARGYESNPPVTVDNPVHPPATTDTPPSRAVPPLAVSGDYPVSVQPFDSTQSQQKGKAAGYNQNTADLDSAGLPPSGDPGEESTGNDSRRRTRSPKPPRGESGWSGGLRNRETRTSQKSDEDRIDRRNPVDTLVDVHGPERERRRTAESPAFLPGIMVPLILAVLLLVVLVVEVGLFLSAVRVSDETRDVQLSDDTRQEESGGWTGVGAIHVTASDIKPKRDAGSVVEIETASSIQLDGSLMAPGENHLSGTASIWNEDSRKFVNAELSGSVASSAASHQQRFQFTGDGQTKLNVDAVYIVLSGNVSLLYDAEPDGAFPGAISYPVYTNNLLVSLDEDTRGEILSGEIYIGHLTQPDQTENIMPGSISMKGKLSIVGSLENQLYPTETIAQTVGDQYIVVNMEEAKSFSLWIATNVLTLVCTALLLYRGLADANRRKRSARQKAEFR